MNNKKPDNDIIFNKTPTEKPTKETPESLLKAALLNLQGLLEILGSEFFPPEFFEWLKKYNVDQKLEDIESLDIEGIEFSVVIKKGKVGVISKFGKKKPYVKKVKVAIKIGGVIIIIRSGDNPESKGAAVLPKAKPKGPIVIILDNLDVPDELSLKSILFHELVHVKQLLDKHGLFQGVRDGKINENGKERSKTDEEVITGINKKFRDNAEAEAHAATLLLCALLIQEHPESDKTIKKRIHDKSLEKFLEHSESASDKKRALDAIFLVLEKLLPDIEKENNKLLDNMDRLKTLREKINARIKDYRKNLPKGDIPQIKKLNKCLDEMNAELAGLEKLIDSFEVCKRTALSQARVRQTSATVLREEKQRLADAEVKLAKKKEELKKAEEAAKITVTTNEAKLMEKHIGQLKEDIRQAEADIKDAQERIPLLEEKLKKETHKKIEWVGGKKVDTTLEELAKSAVTKANKALKALIKKREKVVTTLAKTTDDELALLIGRLLGTLQLPNSTLTKLRFKLKLVEKFETPIAGLISKPKK